MTSDDLTSTDDALSGDVVMDELSSDGVPAADLGDEQLLRELHSLHRTRLDTLRHGPNDALSTHLARTIELETEYLQRYPEREIDTSRVREPGPAFGGSAG